MHPARAQPIWNNQRRGRGGLTALANPTVAYGQSGALSVLPMATEYDLRNQTSRPAGVTKVSL
jgi:hypothetical protein